MVTTKKKIEELEKRISALEKRVATLSDIKEGNAPKGGKTLEEIWSDYLFGAKK